MLVSLAGQFSETRFTGVWASLNFVLLVGFVMAMPILPLLSGTTKRSNLQANGGLFVVWFVLTVCSTYGEQHGIR